MAVNVRLSVFLCVAVVGLMLPLSSLSGQRLDAHFKGGYQMGFGWVANVPTSYLGFSVMGLSPILGGAGLYADFKLTTGSPGNAADFLGNITPEEAELTFGDRLFSEESDWVTVDLALVYAITPELAVYGGAGYSDEKHYREYFDESETRGEFGFYWVADPGNTGTRVNLLGGALMRVNRFAAFQAGGQTQPRGVNVGVILTLLR